MFAVSVRPRKHPQVFNALWNSMTPTGNERETDLVPALRTPSDVVGNFGHFPITCGTSLYSHFACIFKFSKLSK